jgi:hypothetical protein
MEEKIDLMANKKTKSQVMAFHVDEQHSQTSVPVILHEDLK